VTLILTFPAYLSRLISEMAPRQTLDQRFKEVHEEIKLLHKAMQDQRKQTMELIEKMVDKIIDRTSSTTQKALENMHGKIQLNSMGLEKICGTVGEMEKEMSKLKGASQGRSPVDPPRQTEQPAETDPNAIVISGLKTEEVDELGIFEHVRKFFHDKLKVDPPIQKVKRLGDSNRGDKPVPILVTMNSSTWKSKVFKNCYRLSGARISITEDLSPDEREKRRQLMPMYRKAKTEGKKTYFKRADLYIDGQIYKQRQQGENEDAECDEPNQQDKSTEESQPTSAACKQILN
jgi:hypothetical protein